MTGLPLRGRYQLTITRTVVKVEKYRELEIAWGLEVKSY